MTWFSKQGSDPNAFAEAIQPELRALRTPPATRELFDRIIADRRAGARVILPVGRIAHPAALRYAVAAMIVVGALLALPVYRARQPAMRDVQPASQFFYFGEVARAAESPAEQRLPAAIPAHPERVRPGALEYLRVWEDSTARVTKKVSSLLTVTVDGTSWRVASVWRELTSEPQTITAETLLVAQRNLRLLTRVVHVRPYRRW